MERALRSVHMGALLVAVGSVGLGFFRLLPSSAVLSAARVAALAANLAVAVGMATRLRRPRAPIPRFLSWSYGLAVLTGGFFLYAFSHDFYFSRHPGESFTHVFGPPFVLLAYGVTTLVVPNVRRIRQFQRTPVLVDAILLATTTSLIMFALEAWRLHKFEGFRPRYLADVGYWNALFRAATESSYWTVIFPALTILSLLLLLPFQRHPQTYRVTAVVIALLWPVAYLLFARPW